MTTVYHVVTDLESKASTLEEAQQWLDTQTFSPQVPISHSDFEDLSTPRLCVARCIEDCITGIGVRSKFFRCLEKWDAPSYVESGEEQYPIGIVTILVEECNLIKPTTDQVSDADFTGELWITNNEFRIISREIVWLDQFSIDIDAPLDDIPGNPFNQFIDEDNETFDYKCLDVRYSKYPLPGRHHPWIDGLGNTLLSRERESFSQEVNVTHTDYNSSATTVDEMTACLQTLMNRDYEMFFKALLRIETGCCDMDLLQKVYDSYLHSDSIDLISEELLDMITSKQVIQIRYE